MKADGEYENDPRLNVDRGRHPVCVGGSGAAVSACNQPIRDGMITARLVSEGNTHAFAKAGYSPATPGFVTIDDVSLTIEHGPR